MLRRQWNVGTDWAVVFLDLYIIQLCSERFNISTTYGIMM